MGVLMRVCNVLCCSLMLAVMAAAQNPSTTTSDSGQQQQNQPQQPPNPLQQPAKTADQPPKASPSTFELGGAGSAGKDQELGEVRLMTRYTQLNGDTTKSFYVPGENDLAEFNYFYDHRFVVTRRLQALGMFRGTDDKSIDPEHNSLQKGYVRLYGPRDEYVAGDMLVNFSRLSFNNNIRGLDTSWKLGDSWRLTTLGGVYIDRWGSIWKDIAGRPYLATVAGSRLEYKFTKRSTLGFNFAFSKDNNGTLPLAFVGTPPEPVTNKVGSIDLKLQFPWGLRVDSEYAYSFSDFDIRNLRDPSQPPSPCAPPQADFRAPVFGCGTQSDWGARTEASYRWHKLTLRGSFVRYQPNFLATQARQNNDLQDAIFRASYDLTRWLTIDGTGRRSNNNLRGQLTEPLMVVAGTPNFESVLWGPEIHFIFHDLSFYRRAVFELGYRDREVQGVGLLSKNMATTQSPAPPCRPNPDGFSVTCQDQSARMPFAEITVPYHTSSFTAGYELRHTIDNINPNQSSHVHRAYTAMRGIYDLGGWHINPSLRLELELSKSTPNQTRANTSPCNPFAGLADPCLLENDSNRLLSSSLLVEAPRWFMFEAGYRDTSSLARYQAGYNRPSYRAAVTYKLMNDENMLFIFSFMRSNYFYLTAPGQTPITNYDERQWGMSFVYKFGKRR